MSGDNAPEQIVKGALEANREFGVDIILVGNRSDIMRCLSENGAEESNSVSIAEASEVIDMHDDPSTAVRRKKDSSMTVALNLLRDGVGDACVSAGNTGALLTGATLLVKRIRGIRRAAMAPVLPNNGSGFVLIDCGANVECTEEYLLQFAWMGSFYAEKMLGIPNPRVGLLNNGTEETKGTELIRKAYTLLTAQKDAGRLNFIGNIESGDVFSGAVDVVVADGFSGNILLKSVEGTAKFLMKKLKQTFLASLRGKIAALLVKRDIYGLKKLMDPGEVGGTALLGISKPVIKAHGGSDARAIRSAVKQAMEFAQSGITDMITEYVSASPDTAEN